MHYIIMYMHFMENDVQNCVFVRNQSAIKECIGVYALAVLSVHLV